MCPLNSNWQADLNGGPGVASSGMAETVDPGGYDAWYHTPRGAWIGDSEFSLIMRLLRPGVDATLLDVGSGSGYFSRRLACAGLKVTAIDADQAMVRYAHGLDGSVRYVQGTAVALPFGNESFDYVTAVASLCFVERPAAALAEMWRVSRRGVLLGLLNRRSLLYRQKHGRGAYRGARWDTGRRARAWCRALDPLPRVAVRSAIVMPGGGALARIVEKVVPAVSPWGGFLAVSLRKPTPSRRRTSSM